MIRALRRNADLTQQALAAAAGISKAYLSLIESGRRSLTMQRAVAVERALGIDDQHLQQAIAWQRVPSTIREQVQRSRSLQDDMHQRLQHALASDDPLAALRGLVAGDAGVERASTNDAIRLIHSPMPALRRIPIINKVAAGYPREFTDMGVHPASSAPPFDIDDSLACPDVADPDAFAARVVGDSMEPEYCEGDIVVFSPAARISPDGGSDCFVRLERDAEMTFKRIYFEDDGRTIRLQPLNSAYPPLSLPREEVSGMYAAVYVLRRVGRASLSASTR